ncbi:PaaI family thioesterase [Amycolatopsis acidicola]|uniref:PaaI family thioesterase n=1 Tax=Amycolatopsis acidicola TaxID=2596893 RepID=UPI001408EF24|nr:PaaI family thioesterase [Amycolatopsis acidicola]
MADETDPQGVAPYGASEDKWIEWTEQLGVSRAIGLRCAAIGHGRATLVLDDCSWPLNANGAVHGGMVIAAADHCFGIVATTVLDEDHIPATASLTSDFLRPALPPLTFEASVDRVGRTMAFLTVTVLNRTGKVSTKVNGTMVIDGSSRFAR